tara:strand:- start:19207 stop:19506 length:300 start_codon:yes stop_codon:yes gene_type:complete
MATEKIIVDGEIMEVYENDPRHSSQYRPSQSKIDAEILEMQKSEMRAERNKLLQETDWTANSDVTMSAKMKTYRKALRDLPTHKNWPNLESSDWPTKPS